MTAAKAGPGEGSGNADAAGPTAILIQDHPDDRRGPGGGSERHPGAARQRPRYRGEAGAGRRTAKASPESAHGSGRHRQDVKEQRQEHDGDWVVEAAKQ